MTVITISATIFSGISLIWEVIRGFRDAGRLKIEAGIMKWYSGDKDSLVITVANVGRRPVCVTKLVVVEKKRRGKSYELFIPHMPRILKEGEYLREAISDFELLTSHMETICVWDSTGKMWKLPKKNFHHILEEAKSKDLI